MLILLHGFTRAYLLKSADSPTLSFLYTYMTIVMDNFIITYRNVFFLLLILIGSFWMLACHQVTSERRSVIQRETIDSLIKTSPSMDSLIIWLEHYQYIKNKSGMILTCKELGKRYRETAHFDKAIDYHRKGLM